MEKVMIVERQEREKKDGSGKYYIYKAADGRELLSKKKFEQGEQEFLVTPSKDGRSLWINKSSETAAKPGLEKKIEKGPLAGKANELNLQNNALELVKIWLQQGLVAKPKTIDEIDSHVKEAKSRLQKILLG